MSFINSPVFQFFLGGSLVSGITYVANNVSASLASIITAFPIGLIPLFFLHGQNKINKYGLDTTLTNFIVVLTYIVFNLSVRHHIYTTHAIEIACLSWIIMAVLMYYLYFV